MSRNIESGILAIAIERAEQLAKHGISVEMDVENNVEFQLVSAANFLTKPFIDLGSPETTRARPYKWNMAEWLKMCKKPYPDRLAIAGALLAAEYDRWLAMKENHF